MRRVHDKQPHLYLVRKARDQQRDEQVEHALELMRTDLSQRWTVTSLARRVGLSRPAFARRFVASTGVSPCKYLTRARLQQAARLLDETSWSLAQIGARVGYGSEFAFNRAFKRLYRIAPGTYRRRLRDTVPSMRAA